MEVQHPDFPRAYAKKIHLFCLILKDLDAEFFTDTKKHSVRMPNAPISTLQHGVPDLLLFAFSPFRL
jgi:hypothetical protein